MNTNAARSTIRRYYIYSFLGGLQFTFTTWLAYVLARGGNPGWAEAAFHLAILLGEVPTGVVADLLGRRTSMLIGLGLTAASGVATLWIHDTFTACLVMALSGLAMTFASGADTALLYESAVAVGGSDYARRAMARASALSLTALALAPAMAGVMYEWRDWAPAIGQSVVTLLTMAVVWGMVEQRGADAAAPDAARDTAATDPVPAGGDAAQPRGLRAAWAQALATAGAGARVVLANRLTLTLVIFIWFYNTSSAMVGQYAQAYLPYAGFTMAAAGLVFTAAQLSGTAGTFLVERLSPRLADGALRFVPPVIALTTLGMGLHPGLAGAAFFIAGRALDDAIYPMIQHRLNETIPSAQRATILSISNVGFSLMMVFAFPAASYLQPVSRIYVVVGLISLALAVGWAAAAAKRPLARGKSAAAAASAD